MPTAPSLSASRARRHRETPPRDREFAHEFEPVRARANVPHVERHRNRFPTRELRGIEARSSQDRNAAEKMISVRRWEAPRGSPTPIDARHATSRATERRRRQCDKDRSCVAASAMSTRSSAHVRGTHTRRECVTARGDDHARVTQIAVPRRADHEGADALAHHSKRKSTGADTASAPRVRHWRGRRGSRRPTMRDPTTSGQWIVEKVEGRTHCGSIT